MIDNARGFSLIGALITTAIVSVIALGAAEMLRLNAEFLAQTKRKRDRDRIVANMLNMVIESLPVLQRTFDPSDAVRDSLLEVQALPFAWDQDRVLPTNQCPGCPGRMGFAVQPMAGRQGILRLTIRLTHSQFEGGPRDYVFVLADE